MSTRAPRYPADLKAAVVSHAQHHGFAATYEQWPTIEPATIRSWCSRAGIVTTCGTEQTLAATQARRLQWEERRTALVHEIGEAAAVALERTRAELDDGKGREAQTFATTMAILVDKAQLLSGGATARSETVTAQQAHEVIDEIAKRRGRAA